MAALALVLVGTVASAQSTSAPGPKLEVQGAWARATVPGQKATGAFMTLTAREPMRLVGVSSPVAGVSEVHEMRLDAGVMKMRAVEGGLELPAGKPLELRPGGFHLMLMDLKSALAKDSTVPVTLVLRDAKGNESRLELKLPVSMAPPPAANATPGAATGHDAHKH